MFIRRAALIILILLVLNGARAKPVPIGTVSSCKGAAIHGAALFPGTTIFSGDKIDVSAQGNAWIAMQGGLIAWIGWMQERGAELRHSWVIAFAACVGAFAIFAGYHARAVPEFTKPSLGGGSERPARGTREGAPRGALPAGSGFCAFRGRARFSVLRTS